uniref:Uncharacterized protein n=1 Tax=Tanacetum cinerariifolium TaxID=118510 RepID=A0A6L2MLT1_TANCI|nr:hypothetical protein [Tanacetum cinerariifolium]
MGLKESAMWDWDSSTWGGRGECIGTVPWNILSKNINPIATQQATLDNALVPSKKRLKIERCSAIIAFTKPQKEETYQVTLEALKISPCYPAFQITAEVLEIYMHQFWNTIKKFGKLDAYDFKLDKKKYLLTLIKELGYSGKCDMLSTIRTDQMHQPWRTFAAVINRCISGKSIGLDRLRELRAQILWSMYNQINVDYVAFLWEDFMYQADNREISSARKEHMPYPRFTKVIIDHFISKASTISIRNRINLHTSRDDTLLGTLKFFSKTEDYHIYGAVIPDGMRNDDIKLSKVYKTYLDYATGKVPPKKSRKFKKHASPKLKTIPASPKEPTQKGKRVKRATKKATTALTTAVVTRDTSDKSLSKNKAPAKTGKTKDTSEGTGVKPGVLDVSKDDSLDSDNDSWCDSEDKSDDDDEDDNDDDDDEEEQYEEFMLTLERNKSDDDDKMYKEEDDDVAKKLYGNLDITEGLKDADLTNAQQGGEDQLNSSYESGFVQEEEDAHVTLTTVHHKTEGPLQSSFISSDFTSNLLNLDDPSSDINSLMNASTIPPPPPLVNPSSHP